MNKLFLLITALLMLGSTKADVVVLVNRQQTNVASTGCANVAGFDEIVRNGDGSIHHVNRTIQCWDPGRNACPPASLKPVKNEDGTDGIAPGVLAKLNEMYAAADLRIEKGVMTGTSHATVMFYNESNVLQRYVIDLSWSPAEPDITTYTATIRKVEITELLGE